ncbi:MAG: hypothetical protein C0613_10310 [Desulfobulbaceae bacterium]|nr:MAG: hypothetical protein C0613_10310 [Desulfobulbaceae bacterium]
MTSLIPLPPTILFILLCVVPLSTIILLLRRQIRQTRQPFAPTLAETAEQRLQREIDETSVDILTKSLFIALIPITIYSIYATQVALTAKDIDSAVLYTYLIGSALFIASLTRDVYRTLRRRRDLSLNRAGRLAVGQALNQLIPAGFRLFHDLPLGNRTIDHIAVGPQGLFAITSLVRPRTGKKREKEASLRLDGRQLRFPDGTDADSVTTAVKNAAQLNERLQESGESGPPATPVLAVPGWTIDHTAAAEQLQLYNGIEPIFLSRGPVLLNEKQIKSMAIHLARQLQ